MFKCSECGAEYKVKPEYCECGNNIFYETGKEVDDIDIDDDIDNIDQINDIEDEIPQHHRRKTVQKAFSPLGIGIFSFCIILSILVLFFIGNPKKTPQKKTTEPQTTAQNLNIPSVDSYWDNTVAKIETPKTQEPEETEKQMQNIIPNFVKQIIPNKQPETAIAQKTVYQPALKKQVQKQTQKQTPKQIKKTVTKQNKPKTKPAQKKQQSVQTSPFSALTNRVKKDISTNNQPQKNTVSKPATTQTVNTSKPAPLPSKTVTKTTTQTVNTQPAKPLKSQAQLRQELSSYKAGLRNTIGRRIDFTKVIGDGSCSLAFKVNSNGKLYSKTFTKQSSNITLNDAVFNALNTTTSYNPPPDGYNGETLRLNIRFYNGNFEISLQ